MAKSGAVWGIDIGQCALKALRCRRHESDTNRIVVEAFDYIEYPKLLSQQDANREELIAEALETFLSRNEIQGDSVAISVPGQSGLARFIKLPPVEAKKIPDIVKYEARQQIPFALEDVVWDYQPLAGGNQDEGYALETEVGLFAMKRDQVARALDPLEAAGIEVETIQLAPLAVYNFATFDRLNNLEDAGDFDPDNQPNSIALLSFGAESTDLVVTNGYRVWQRNIPIGGSHFTKALAKEMKITFAKAEHLKRNATQAEDPKAVFKAMRSVFSDLLAEIQRSIGFFKSNNRDAEIDEVIALGNPMQLPGLQRYLAQNLEQTVKPIEEYTALVGGSVTAAPQFQDNLLSFAVSYGLCVQELGLAKLGTTLLPEEIITTRLIRSKKPWAIAAAAMLLVGLTINYFSYVSSWKTVNIEDDWKNGLSSAQSFQTTTGNFMSRDAELRTKFDDIAAVGSNLQSNADGRLLWLELFKAIDAAVPKDERPEAEREKTVTDVAEREELHIESIDCQYFPDLSTWFTGPIQKMYSDALRSDELEATAVAAAAAAAGELDETVPAEGEGDADAATADGAPADGVAAEGAESEDAADVESEELPLPGEEDSYESDDYAGEDVDAEGGVQGPSEAGWVIQLVGHHFHNSNKDDPENKIDFNDEGERFVRKTLIKNLLEQTVMLPDGDNGELVEVTMQELGITFPVIVTALPIMDVTYDPEAESEENAGRPVGGGGGYELGGFEGAFGAESGDPEVDPEEKLWKLRRYDFVIQFVWKPTPRNVRKDGPAEGDEGGGDIDNFSAMRSPEVKIALHAQR